MEIKRDAESRISLIGPAYSNTVNLTGDETEQLENFIKYDDLTKIETPFGLLPQKVRQRLEDINNGKNIQILQYQHEWTFLNPSWSKREVYRLNPKWEPEEVKEVTMSEVEEKFGTKVKIIK